MRCGRHPFLFSIAIWLIACGTALAGNEELYDSLHPFYAEACAVSQIKKKPGFGADIRGGPGGHSVLYLNGVCRVKEAHYPTIALCGSGTAASSQGVGLSVNAHFKNAYWIATEGKDFFFHGDLKSDERLTRAVYQRTQEHAKEMDILDGVEFHSEVFDDMPPGESKRDYMYEMSVSTDYAIGFGRDHYCVRVPLGRAQMDKAVQFLNEANEPYRGGREDFVWNVLQNNCSHMTHNALSAAGLWDDWPINRFILISAFDFPVPANEFVNLARRTNDMALYDLESLYNDAGARRALMTDGWLPTQAGALVEWESVKQANDLYDTDVQLIFYDEPLFAVYWTGARNILSQPRYSDVRANLAYFSDLYKRIARDRKPVAWYLRKHPDMPVPKRQEFPIFYDQFYRYVASESVKIDAQLASLPTSQ